MFTFDDYLQEELKNEQATLEADLDYILMKEMRYLIEDQDEDMDYSIARGVHSTSNCEYGPDYDRVFMPKPR